MEQVQINETLKGLLEILQYEKDTPEKLEHLATVNSRYLKDLKINISNSFRYETLSPKESALLALGVALNEKRISLAGSLIEKAKKENASDEEIAETYSCVSLLNVNNVFYRFRHFTNKEFYNTSPAGIKMSIMMNPLLGKEFFELMSLGISALNGCELCVTSHEDSLINLGTSQQRIYDAIRLCANVKGLCLFFD